MDRGWEKRGPQSYGHDCGARVWGNGKQSWTAKTVEGSLRSGFPTVVEATQWIETHDPDFWTVGRPVSWGFFGSVAIESVEGYLDAKRTQYVIVLSIPDVSKFSPNLQGVFRKRFFSHASCAKCGKHPSDIHLNPPGTDINKSKRRALYIVCDCGYPVWRISREVCDEIARRMWANEHARENAQFRKELLEITGGKHTKREIQEILRMQENRCIYCNVLFTGKEIPTRDHLIPITRGGTDWALNIVMACHSCNSRRSTKHFRAYCKRLRPSQQRLIFQHLSRRLNALLTFA